MPQGGKCTEYLVYVLQWCIDMKKIDKTTKDPLKQVIVYGGHGKEDKRQKWVDEFGNPWVGTGAEAKSYYRGRNQALSIIFKESKKRK